MDLTKETNSLVFYSVVIICPIGIITNLMNIKVSRSEEIQKTSMSFFNIRLSIFNILVIVFVGFIISFPPSIGEQMVTLNSELACKLIPYFSRIICQMSSWLLVIASFDRMFMLMSYKNKNNVRDPQEIKDTTKLSRIVVSLFFLFCLINIPNLLFTLETQTVVDSITNSTTQTLLCTSSKNIVLIRDVIAKTSYGILPFILQIIISACLIYRLFKLDSVIHTVPINRERKYTFTIIVFNIIFILADVFSTICIVLINYYGYNETTYVSTNSKEAAISSYAYVCSIFLNLFCVCDLLFFINLITNKRFRKEAISIFLY